mgnify:CR=1 FL=1
MSSSCKSVHMAREVPWDINYSWSKMAVLVSCVFHPKIKRYMRSKIWSVFTQKKITKFNCQNIDLLIL